MPKSGNAGFGGRLIPDFLRNCHTHFQSGCTSLHSHQQSDSTSAPTYVSSVVLIITILTGKRRYLRIILFYFSLNTKDFEQFLKCLLAIWESSVEDLLFKPVPHFLTGLLVFWCTVFFFQFIIYFGDKSSVWCEIGGALFQFSRLLFCIIDHVLCFIEYFQFQEVSFIDYWSQCLCYRCYV